MNVSYVNHPETNDVIETAAEAETDAKVESRDKPPAKKRKWKIPKLKLFFWTTAFQICSTKASRGTWVIAVYYFRFT